MKRKSSRTSQTQIDDALKKLKADPDLSYREVGKDIGVCKSTVCRWVHKDMSQEAVNERKTSSAHKKISNHQEDIMVGGILRVTFLI